MDPATQPSTLAEVLRIPQHWPAQTDLLTWAQQMTPGVATLLVLGGLVYLLFGFYLFKMLVTLNAALVGAAIGGRIGQFGGSMPTGACIGAFVAGAMTWPMMKYAVALMGGIFGALLGASVWRSLNLDPNLASAGAMMGLVTFGMLSFIIFKGSVIMYTSLQGSVMLIFGILGLIYKYQSVAPHVTSSMQLQPFILPMAILVPAILGLLYQQAQNAPAEAAGAKKK